MTIQEIEIYGLFGYLNHRIPLMANDRITIIHGPNGVGKTTILRLISNLLGGKFVSLFVTPFHRIVVRFASNRCLTVDRILEKQQDRPSHVKLNLEYLQGNESIITHTVSSQETRKLLREYPPRYIESVIDNVRRVSPSEWYDEATDELMSLSEVVLKYGHMLPNEIRESILPIPPEIANLFEQTNIVVVETQRLVTRYEDSDDELSSRYKSRRAVRQRMTVEQYSEDMISRIKEYQRRSGELGAELDRTFPQRLLKKSLSSAATEENIRSEYSHQSKYRDRLMKSGLIAAESTVPLPKDVLAEHEREVLWIYLNDIKSKLEVFDPLLQCVELFKNIVNSRFSYKKFEVSKEIGFVFESNHDRSILPPGVLSSGEQHEIVLTYELLFRAPEGSLIFIDEPELSLHVTWQRKFLEDIAKISKLADLHFLVATHSPQIIHNRRDLLVELAKGEEG